MNDLASATALMDPAQADPVGLLPGARLFEGQFTLAHPVRVGRFDRIYGAKDTLGRDVFLKLRSDVRRSGTNGTEDVLDLCNPLTAASRRASFVLQEANCLSSADHPNIMSFHQSVEEARAAETLKADRTMMLLLDRVRGGEKALTPDEIVAIARKLLAATKCIHDFGRLHGDISPRSILLGKDKEPFLIDFGAARTMSQDLLTESLRPCDADDDAISEAGEALEADLGPMADLSALGCTLYDTVVGSAAASAGLSAGSEAADNRTLSLAGRFAGYPPGFLETIDQALALRPEERFPTADAWLEALDKPLDHKEFPMKLLGRTIGLRRTALDVAPAPASDEQTTPADAHDQTEPKVGAVTDPITPPSQKLILERNLMSVDLSGLKEINGFIAGCLVDCDSGLMLASELVGKFDIETAAAANVEVVRGKQNAIRLLGLNDHIEEILISLGLQLHLIRPLEKMPSMFLYASLDRKSANLGMARLQLKKVEQSISL